MKNRLLCSLAPSKTVAVSQPSVTETKYLREKFKGGSISFWFVVPKVSCHDSWVSQLWPERRPNMGETVMEQSHSLHWAGKQSDQEIGSGPFLWQALGDLLLPARIHCPSPQSHQWACSLVQVEPHKPILSQSQSAGHEAHNIRLCSTFQSQILKVKNHFSLTFLYTWVPCEWTPNSTFEIKELPLSPL